MPLTKTRNEAKKRNDYSSRTDKASNYLRDGRHLFPGIVLCKLNDLPTEKEKTVPPLNESYAKVLEKKREKIQAS